MIPPKLLLFAAALVSLAACRGENNTGAQPGKEIADKANKRIPVSTTTAYTLAADSKHLSFGPGTKRLALLIGNGSYHRAARAEGESQYSQPLPRLANPCSDVKSVALKLSDIGWRADEIYVLCEQSNEQVYDAISVLIGSLPIASSEPPRLSLLYLAGHGMLVDSRNYFFGVNSRFDYSERTDALLNGLGNGPDYRIFDKSQGVDLYHAFSPLLNAPDNDLKSPMLVIVDTCRNNPFISFIDAAAKNAASQPRADAKVSAMRWQLVRDRVSSMINTRTVPNGLEFLYATKPNNTIKDDGGKGKSRLAEQFSKNAVPDIPVRELIYRFELAFRNANRSLPTDEWQKLSHEGDLYAGEDWCLHGCKRPGPAEGASASSRQGWPQSSSNWLVPTANAAALPPVRVAPQVPQSRSITGKETLARRYSATAPRRVMVDVHWCSGDAKAEARHRAALKFTSNLTSSLNAANLASGRSQIFAVRFREITAEMNRLAAYQRNTNQLYVDPVQTEPDENRLAERYINPLIKGMSAKPDSQPTKDYIDVSFCKGAYIGPRAARVFVHIRSANSAPVASEVMARIAPSSPDLLLVPTVENISKRPKFNFGFYPRQTEIRIFSEALRARSKQLAQAMAPLLPHPVAVRCFRKKCPTTASEKTIEIWIGSEDQIASLRR